MAQRIFIALDVPAAIQQRLSQACRALSWGEANVNFVASENVHLTLHFLGDVDDADQPAVFEALTEATEGLGPVEFEIGQLACVPPQGRDLRMIWADVLDPDGELQRLYNELASALVQRGFGVESRPYRAHLTLARVKAASDADAIRQAIAAETFGSVRARQVVVYASELAPTGPVYSVLGQGELAE